MMAHDRAQLPVSEHANDLGAFVSVAPHDLCLLASERAGLVEHLRRDAQLADVMHGCRGPDRGHRLTRESHPASYLRGVSGDTPRMTVGIRILRVKRASQLLEELGSSLAFPSEPRLLLGVLEPQQFDGVGKLPLVAPAPQPSPDQKFAEEQIPRPA